MVFAERGPENTVIDHIVTYAGVSRGSFYNYFRSIEELLDQAKYELAQQMISLVSQTALRQTDAAVQLAFGLGGFVQILRDYPIYLQFSDKLGTKGLGEGSIVRTTAPIMLQQGIETGRFIEMPDQVAVDLVEATGLSILRRLIENGTVDETHYITALLRMFGVPQAEAAEIANRPVPPIDVPSDSLLARTATRTAFQS